MHRRFPVDRPVTISPDTIVLLSDTWFEPAPPEVWPEKDSVGVVRSVLGSDSVLVERSIGLETVANPNTLNLELGNTITYRENGVQEILSERPIRDRDPEIQADDPIQQYRVDADNSAPSFEDFGGYQKVVERAKQLIETQLDHREALDAIGARPVKGVLFTGPPGTGKTMLARIIAKESKAAFFLISGPSVVSKWVGDSEETLRAIFRAASEQPRSIIFFDEIDSLAEKRTGESHEASKRIVAQLLTLMDGFKRSEGSTVVIAATNRIDDIDIALRRPGRFDWEIEFGMPNTDDRLAILVASKRSLATTGDLPLEELAVRTDGWSAAQLASLWTEAALLAAGDHRSSISEEDLAEAFDRVKERLAPAGGVRSNG
ncbi:ATP-binding protein [Mycobacteroides salmoniphilum]|uniref:ATP-dependent zinc metalloprotease FtsH n=1 Tax=Mycobacteroides salmoniphilum TaxID=404941 RepID=A0A4R8SE63_9MYCO|nr:AAA family ATPase [Mycobacteroides salmoniphilum]TDZ93731.1 ATP-dependent zinc metalloprotease FtsH [Mycobacteroides salmoniphilum]TEA09514.1 ATP-dependent zinc metalloprotease FtsH [Mycobacteroides salmoniphilum]